jgi:hypothetical protein
MERRSDAGRDGHLRVEQDGEDVLVWIKAVPGASGDQIAGVLGDRLKIRVSAPAEGGKANKAICTLLARVLGVKAARISIESGRGTAAKTVRVSGTSAAAVLAALR